MSSTNSNSIIQVRRSVVLAGARAPASTASTAAVRVGAVDARTYAPYALIGAGLTAAAVALVAPGAPVAALLASAVAGAAAGAGLKSLL